MPDFNYDIIKHIGVISEGSGGWQKELNLISWNGKDPKFDIRDWGPETTDGTPRKMGKGVTLSKADIDALKALLENE